MGGLNCVDAPQKPSSSYKNFSHEQAFDSSGEYFEDEDSDIRSFISGRSPMKRECRVWVQRKMPQPQMMTPEPCSWTSYPWADDAKNMLKGRENTRETFNSSDQTSVPNMVREDSRENNVLLVVADDDVKKQIKEIMQPYMLKRVHQIVDRAVEDMFANVNSVEQLSYGSRQCVQRSYKADSGKSPEESNHLNQLSKKDVEHGRATTAMTEVSVASASNPPCEPIMIKVSPHELSSCSKDGDLINTAVRKTDFVEDVETESPASMRRISSLKLAQFPSFELDISKIKDMVPHVMEKSRLDADYTIIDKPLPVNHGQSAQPAARQVGPGEI